MNNLQKIIAGLNPLVYCDSTSASGIGVVNPSNGANIGTWKNLMGNNNWDFRWWDYFIKPTQFGNTLSPTYKTNKFNGLPAIDLTKSFLIPNNYTTGNDPITEGTNEYTVIRVKQVNDIHKFDWDTGSATAQLGTTLDYSQQQSNSERVSRNGVELFSGRLFPPFIENGARNTGITTSIMRWEANSLEIQSWFTNDNRYKYSNKTSDVPAPRLRKIQFSSNGYGLPMIGGVWNRADNSNNEPYGYGTLNGTVSEAMLYYDFILFDRYLSEEEIRQVQSYLKQKYNI